MAAFEKSRVRGSGFGPWRATPPVRISFRGCAGCGPARAPAAPRCVSHAAARFPRPAAHTARRGRAHTSVNRSKVAPIDRAPRPRLTAADGGVFGDIAPPETWNPRGLARRARPRTRRIRGRARSVAGRRAAAVRKRAARKTSSCSSRRVWPSSNGASASLARAVEPAGGLWIAWPKKTSYVATDLTRERRARCRPGERSRRQQGVRGRRHVGRVAVRVPAPRPSAGRRRARRRTPR